MPDEMYRRMGSPTPEDPLLVNQAVLLIFPDYFAEQQKVLKSLLQAGISVIEKRPIHLSLDFVLSWLSLCEKEGGWDWADRAADGMSLAVVVQRQNLFFHLPSIVISINSKSGYPADVVYCSQDTVSAFRDLSHFFPNHVSETEFLKQAEDYLKEKVLPPLYEALAGAAVRRPADPVRWIADFLRK